MNTHDYEYVEALKKRLTEARKNYNASRDYAIRLESTINRFGGALDKINNIAVGFVEGGPYEDANRIALTAMLAVDELSRMPERKEATHA